MICDSPIGIVHYQSMTYLHFGNILGRILRT